MKRKLHIVVVGSDKDHCSEKAKEIAYEVGKEIAKAGAIILTGGQFGVMEAASKGAQENNGLVVGILPRADKFHGNEYIDVVIPTGIGFARGQALINSADGVIAVEGGTGTLSELCVSYWSKIPTVAIIGSGGTADKFAGQKLDSRERAPIVGVKTAKEAVEYILKNVKERHSHD